MNLRKSDVYVHMRHKLLRQDELAAELEQLDEQIDELKRTGGRPAAQALDDHTLARFAAIADRLYRHYEEHGWPGQWPLASPGEDSSRRSSTQGEVP
jgi:hypothetical protein